MPYYFTADFVLTPDGLEQGLAVEMEGAIITGLVPVESVKVGQLQHYPGILSPGLVNAHCHLELSYMKGKVPRNTGMRGFIETLQKTRSAITETERIAAISKAYDELVNNGIVALGDICNGDQTLAIKEARDEIAFFNFIEVFSLNPDQAVDAVEHGQELVMKFGPKSSSLTLHAPYSASRRLRDMVWEQAVLREAPVSVHLLESVAERRLFQQLEGSLMDFIREIGAAFHAATYKSPVHFILDGLPENYPSVLLVHNTELEEEEARVLADKMPGVRFVLCPNANLYINDKLPPAELFRVFPERVCLGTDSLASNTQLDLIDEARVLQQGFPELDTELILQWATINGARALEKEAILGSLEKGKSPGLIHIHPVGSNKAELLPETKAALIVAPSFKAERKHA